MLKIVADDLGLHKLINDGIILGLEKGFINGASLMPIGEEFDDAVIRTKNLNKAVLGIHFVLIDEKPLALKTLPQNHKTFFIKYILGLIKRANIENELRAQLNKCIKAGIKPAFINSHQHLHLLPGIMDIVIGLAKEHEIPYVRIINEPVPLGKRKIIRKVQLLFLNFLSKLAKNKIEKAGLLHNDYFIGFINAGDLTRKDVLKAEKIKHINPDKIVELGCHPGFESAELIDKYGHWQYNWQKELEILRK